VRFGKKEKWEIQHLHLNPFSLLGEFSNQSYHCSNFSAIWEINETTNEVATQDHQ